jgi:excisionase family DNA binding protein
VRTPGKKKGEFNPEFGEFARLPESGARHDEPGNAQIFQALTVYYSGRHGRVFKKLRQTVMARLLSRAEVAGLLNVSIRTLDRLRASGALKGVYVRGRVLFDPADVEAYLAAQRGNGH